MQAGSPAGYAVLRIYLRMLLSLLRHICGIDYVVHGREHIPDEPCLFASRHESAWENVFFQLILDNPAVVIKREITRYPIAGQVARMNKHIVTGRNGDVVEFRDVMKEAQEQMDTGRSVLIFPSGTRRAEDRNTIQSGVNALYRQLNCPCVPIVHDAGKCWPYGRLSKYPGTIQVRILPPIPPGLGKREFLKMLKSRLSNGS